MAAPPGAPSRRLPGEGGFGVARLETRLAKYELVERISRFKTLDEFSSMKRRVMKFFAKWLRAHFVTVDGDFDVYSDVNEFKEIVKEMVVMWTGTDKLGDHLAWLCYEHVKAFDYQYYVKTASWCREHIFYEVMVMLDKHLYKIGASNFCHDDLNGTVNYQEYYTMFQSA